MITELVASLQKEQQDDEKQKDFCNKALPQSAVDKAAIQQGTRLVFIHAHDGRRHEAVYIQRSSAGFGVPDHGGLDGVSDLEIRLRLLYGPEEEDAREPIQVQQALFEELNRHAYGKKVVDEVIESSRRFGFFGDKILVKNHFICQSRD